MQRRQIVCHQNLRGPAVLVLGSLLWLAGLATEAANLVAINPLGLRIPRGFTVAQWSDAAMANDIRAMTLDAEGRVVVTGPGYIRTLLDLDEDGQAESAVEYASLPAGGQGLCADGPNLYCVAGNALLRFSDLNGDGQADGPPGKLLSLDTSENGAYSIRKGPDGFLYLIAGNEMNFKPEHVSIPRTPIRTIEGGALLRLPPAGGGSECIAHGFRSPRDFDFNWMGDLFTFDSDAAPDLFLPWYLPARLYQIGYAGHHGWRLKSPRRSWPRPPYSPDTVGTLALLGHAVPSGVVCYRHFQFPMEFRNGLFFCDWASGRVYFSRLSPIGSGYVAAPEVFMEPIGASGFTPIDLAVTPDGSLLVAAGGNRTQGAIYRIDFPPGLDEVAANDWFNLISPDLLTVLTAPQPLEAWSRAVWGPLAEEFGPEPFAQVVTDNRSPPSSRVRAVEILTEMFGGLAPNVAAAGAATPLQFVRARVAWSLGRTFPPHAPWLLRDLARSEFPPVRRSALEALADHASELEPVLLQQALAANLAYPDPQVRQGAARLASLLPVPAWRALWAQQAKETGPSRLTAILANLWRSPANVINISALEAALSVLPDNRDAALHLDAIRLVILALGDYRLVDPSLELYAPYESAISLEGNETIRNEIQKSLHEIFPGKHGDVNREAARLLAMIRDDGPETSTQVLSLINPQSSPADDFHYLTVISRLTGPWPANATPRIANALLSMDEKLRGLEVRPQLNWPDRLTELVQNLLGREPGMAQAILRHPKFAAPAHVLLAGVLGANYFEAAARLFLAEVKTNARFGWTGSLVTILAALAPAEVFPLFRQQWTNPALRDDLILALAQKPEVIDYDKFLAGLSSPNLRVARASLGALKGFKNNTPMKALLPGLLLLQRLMAEPAEQSLRQEALALIEREAGQSFRILDPGNSPEAVRQAYQPVFDWCLRRYPALGRQILGDVRESPGVWSLRLKSLRWDAGDPGRGEWIYRSKGCQLCHSASGALGPNLSGITQRYSTESLFDAILYPSRQVADPYRSTTFITRNKQTFTGLVISETVESILLQVTATRTFRLNPSDVISRQPSLSSIMPSGLLSGLKPADLADFYAYLKSL